MKKTITIVVLLSVIFSLIACDTANSPTNVCNTCGKKISDNVKLCPYCLERIDSTNNDSDKNLDTDDSTQKENNSMSGESGEGSTKLPLRGKTIVCFGDSLFGMYTGDSSAPAYVAEYTGATVYNVGFSGCRMSRHPYIGYNEFCMYALADAVASGDWSLQEANAASGSANFPDQLTILKGIDFSDVDAIVIHYGTNDFTAGGGGVAIDNTDNPKDTTTVCGALRYSIETLLTAYPKLQIFVSVPAFRTDVTTNSSGKGLTEYVDAIADTAKEYNLPVIDSYYGLGINKVNAATFLADGVHHNIEGRKRFGEYIGAKLISYGDTFRDSENRSSSTDATDEVG